MTASLLSRLLRLLSRLACLIVIVSFVLFAVNQTGTASTHQQDEVNNTALPSSTGAESSASESPVRKAIEKVSNKITSPFSKLTSGSTNKWVIHGGNTLLALLIYGLGVGFLARVLTVRV